MQSLLIPIIAALVSGVSILATAAGVLRRYKSIDKGAIAVVNKASGKTAVLPRNYSPAAVERLLEVTA